MQTKLDRRSSSSSGLLLIEKPVIVLIKSLMYPMLVVALLALWLAIYGVAFTGVFVLLSVVSFFATISILGDVRFYRNYTDFPWMRSIYSIFFRWSIVMLIVFLIFRESGFCYLFYLPAVHFWATSMPPILIFVQYAMKVALRLAAKSNKHKRKTVVVGFNDLGLNLVRNIRKDIFADMEVVGFFEDRSSTRMPKKTGETLLGKPKNLPEFIRRHDIQAVFIALPMARQPRILELLEALRDSTVSIYFLPDVFVADLMQARFNHIGSIPTVAV